MLKQIFSYLLILTLAIGQAVYAPCLAQSSYEKIADNDIKIYPNPAVDQFTLELNTDIKIKSISINNIIGKEVMKFPISRDQIYNVSGLKRGIYIVRVFSENDEPVKVLRLSKS